MPVTNRVLKPYWQSDCGRATVYVGDNVSVMSQMEPNQFHAVVTDPPYGLEFDVGHVKNDWDAQGDGKGFQRWFESRADWMLQVAKPGAHLLSFGGTRMWHRLACAVEDAGWEIRDCMMWLYSSGYPKGRDISKDIDKILGFERDVVDTVKLYDTVKIRPGFTGVAHTTYKDAPMKMVDITVPKTEAAKQWDGWNTTLKPGWEPIVVARKKPMGSVAQNTLDNGCGGINVGACRVGDSELWPANLLHDGIEALNRWFYAAKASADPNNRPHGRDAAVQHPTVKPLDLMQYLVRLVCAKGGTILDPFSGSFSTGVAAIMEGMRFVGIEREVEYADIGVGRMKLALAGKPESETPNSPNGYVKSSSFVPPPKTRLRGT